MDLHLINKNLKDIYGQDGLGQAKFRIVWSDDQIEKRFETFKDWVPGTNIFLREVKEVRECKKYNYLEPQYVLEMLMFNADSKVVDSRTLNPRLTTYEPFYAFGLDEKNKKNGRPKPLVFRAVQLLIDMHFNPKPMPSASDMNEMEMKRYQEDEKVMYEYLCANEKQSVFGSSVHDGDTVVMPTNFEKESPLIRDIKEVNNG